MEPISTTVAAELLGTTPPTVRRLLENGTVSGSRKPRGSRFEWVVDPVSVDAFLRANGRIDHRRRPAPSKADRLEAQIDELRGRLESLEAANSSAPETTSGQNDPRVDVVNLQYALVRTRAALALQRRADVERAAQVDHLLQAAAASERAEGLRREALDELDEALAGFTRPGHLGQVESGQS